VFTGFTLIRALASVGFLASMAFKGIVLLFCVLVSDFFNDLHYWLCFP
jgi:hypothetical protein